VKEAATLTGVRTKRELIDLALRELIRSRRKKNLFDLAGKIQFADDYDHSAPGFLGHGLRPIYKTVPEFMRRQPAHHIG
jgi:Bacterial antitoxin of type II TA system, VapB